MSGSPASCARLISAASAAAHSFQVNSPRSCSASVMAKASASHGSRNTGPSASRGMLGTSCVARACCGLVDHVAGSKIRFPGVDRDCHRRVGGIAPQVGAVEAHGIEPLRVLAGALRVAVGKNVKADDALDDAGTPAHVARQPRVRRRIDVFGAHFVARLECGLRVGVALGWTAAMQNLEHVGGRKHALDRLRLAQGMADDDLVVGDEVALLRASSPARRTRAGNSSSSDIRRDRGSRGRNATCRCSMRPAWPWRASARRRASPSRRGTPARPAPAEPARSPARRRGRVRRSFQILRTFRQPGADHGIARDQFGEFLLAPAFGAGGAHRDDEITNLGGRIPHADFGVLGAA